MIILFKLFLVSVLLHIIDDFVLQPICLSKLKQREWWIEECKKNCFNFDYYQNDYRCALIIHSISWTLMIMMPLIIFCNCTIFQYILLIIVNVIIHYITDDLKANRYIFNLVQDQIIHFIQIFVTYLFFANMNQ